jgi:putative transposase
MRTRHKINEQEAMFFVTSTIIKWIPVFINEKYMNCLIEPIKYYQEKQGLKVYAYVVLDNHFHMLVSGENVSDCISSIKSYSAKKILAALKEDNKEWLVHLLEFYKLEHKQESKHQIWQEGFHPQQIFTDHMLHQKFDYIHFNPVKRGLVLEPEHWRYSSAAYYICDKNVDLKIAEMEL